MLHQRDGPPGGLRGRNVDTPLNEMICELLPEVQKVLVGLCCPGSRYRREAWGGTAPQLSASTEKVQRTLLLLHPVETRAVTFHLQRPGACQQAWCRQAHHLTGSHIFNSHLSELAFGIKEPLFVWFPWRRDELFYRNTWCVWYLCRFLSSLNQTLCQQNLNMTCSVCVLDGYV